MPDDTEKKDAPPPAADAPKAAPATAKKKDAPPPAADAPKGKAATGTYLANRTVPCVATPNKEDKSLVDLAHLDGEVFCTSCPVSLVPSEGHYTPNES